MGDHTQSIERVEQGLSKTEGDVFRGHCLYSCFNLSVVYTTYTMVVYGIRVSRRDDKMSGRQHEKSSLVTFEGEIAPADTRTLAPRTGGDIVERSTLTVHANAKLLV